VIIYQSYGITFYGPPSILSGMCVSVNVEPMFSKFVCLLCCLCCENVIIFCLLFSVENFFLQSILHCCSAGALLNVVKEVMFLSDMVCLCLSVCEQDNSISYGRIFLKF